LFATAPRLLGFYLQGGYGVPKLERASPLILAHHVTKNGAKLAYEYHACQRRDSRCNEQRESFHFCLSGQETCKRLEAKRTEGFLLP